MKLRELRTKSGLTQNEIATRLGVSGQTILNWENGIYEPKINQLIQLADLFSVSVDYLIERKNTNKSIDDICKELEKISKEDFIEFVRHSHSNKWFFANWYIFGTQRDSNQPFFRFIEKPILH